MSILIITITVMFACGRQNWRLKKIGDSSVKRVRVVSDTPLHVPLQRRGIIITIFRGFWTNCLRTGTWHRSAFVVPISYLIQLENLQFCHALWFPAAHVPLEMGRKGGGRNLLAIGNVLDLLVRAGQTSHVLILIVIKGKYPITGLLGCLRHLGRMGRTWLGVILTPTYMLQ